MPFININKYIHHDTNSKFGYLITRSTLSHSPTHLVCYLERASPLEISQTWPKKLVYSPVGRQYCWSSRNFIYNVVPKEEKMIKVHLPHPKLKLKRFKLKRAKFSDTRSVTKLFSHIRGGLKREKVERMIKEKKVFVLKYYYSY